MIDDDFDLEHEEFRLEVEERIEKFASTPNERGNYPSDSEVEEYQREVAPWLFDEPI